MFEWYAGDTAALGTVRVPQVEYGLGFRNDFELKLALTPGLRDAPATRTRATPT